MEEDFLVVWKFKNLPADNGQQCFIVCVVVYNADSKVEVLANHLNLRTRVTSPKTLQT